MFEVEVYNSVSHKTFIKVFNDRRKMLSYVRKVKFSKVLILLSMTDNSYFYD